jgi:hypothetical protein
VAWRLGPAADSLRVGGVRPVQVDRVREGARDRHLQAREFLLDRRAMLGADFVTQFFEHGTAAATLTRLFFIGFSLRVRDLQLSFVNRTRTAYLLTGLVVIAVDSAFVLMPGQSRAALAAEILIVSVGGGLTSSCVSCGCFGGTYSVYVRLILRWHTAGTTWVLATWAGISLLIGVGGGLFFLAFAALLSISHEVAGAWSLIVQVGRATRAKDIMPRAPAHAERPPVGQLAAEEDGSGTVPGQ